MNIQKNLALAGFVLAALAMPAAHAAGTAAGTVIQNTAELTYDAPDPGNPGGPGVPTTTTDTKNFAVDEVLDVNVAVLGGGTTLVTPGSTDREIKYTVQNTGNGSEQYNLVINTGVTGDQFDPTGVEIWIDSDNDGTADYQYFQGTTNLVLTPDQQVTVIVRGDIPAAAVTGDESLVDLRALADTIQQVKGTGFQTATAGETISTETITSGGSTLTYNVVAGTSLGDQQDQGRYLVQDVTASLKKDATALHPTLGAGVFAPGAVVTYTLTLEVSGDGTITSVRMKDLIPANTSYANGSLTLKSGDGANVAAALAAAQAATPVVLTETATGDAGIIISNEINVLPGGTDGNLSSGTVTVGGTEPAAKVYIVSFNVTIN